MHILKIKIPRNALFAFLILLASEMAGAQFVIPGNGSVEMPPNCQAQYYYANYCIEANIIPMDLNLYQNSLEWGNIVQKNGFQAAFQCRSAILSWRSCSRYLQGQLDHKNNDCGEYWKRNYFQDAATNNVTAMRLQKMTEVCGGVTE